VIDGYAMVFGVAIVTGGRLADMFGRRRVFFIGAGVFATFSVIGGFAPNIWLLLTSRFIMGIGGAMMWPAILGMRFSLCPKSRAGLAGGLGSAGFGNAFGPLLGGVLVIRSAGGWCSDGIHIAFLIDGVLAVCGAVVALLFVGGTLSKRSSRRRGRIPLRAPEADFRSVMMGSSAASRCWMLIFFPRRRRHEAGSKGQAKSCRYEPNCEGVRQDALLP
jgi:MFS family permease